jgi:hypothetical protein
MIMKKGGKIFNLNTNIRTRSRDRLVQDDSDTNKESVNINTNTDYLVTKNDTKTKSMNLSTKDYFYNKKMQLYKTEICRSHSEMGYCKYGNKCQFAHDINELRNVNRHPRYKTETCRTFWEEGSCPYGKRCCFIHIKNKLTENNSIEFSNIKEKTEDIKNDLSFNIINVKEDASNIKNSLNVNIGDIKHKLDENIIDQDTHLSCSRDILDDDIEITSIDVNLDVNKKHTPTKHKNCAYNDDDIRKHLLSCNEEINTINFNNYFNNEISSSAEDDDIEMGNIDISSNVPNKIIFELPDGFHCKDYEIRRPLQKEWNDKYIKLSKEDSLFMENLFVKDRRPFWESNEASRWTNGSLFYVNMNNHKWI